jgi:hypothetical protein
MSAKSTDFGKNHTENCSLMHGRAMKEIGIQKTLTFHVVQEDEPFVSNSANNEVGMNPKSTLLDPTRFIRRKVNDFVVQKGRTTCFFHTLEGDKENLKIRVKWREKAQSFLAKEITDLVVEQLKETAEDMLQMIENKPLVTSPEYLYLGCRRLRKEASMIGGQSSQEMMNETSAAALAFSSSGASYKGLRNISKPTSGVLHSHKNDSSVGLFRSFRMFRSLLPRLSQKSFLQLK